MPKKKDPPPDVVDPFAPKRPNPSKIVAKVLSGVYGSDKAAKKAAKKGKKKRE